MIEKLRDCYDKTHNGSSVQCLQEDLKGSLAALYKRGLVDTKYEDVNGKKLLCIIVTDRGVKFLESLES